jgi:hypothetical protein
MLAMGFTMGFAMGLAMNAPFAVSAIGTTFATFSFFS